MKVDAPFSSRSRALSQKSLPEQQEIVRRVEGLFALADQLEVRLEKARSRVSGITPSLLARAFAGQLVPQDPTDEPAEKLLERIRTHASKIFSHHQNNKRERPDHAKTD